MEKFGGESKPTWGGEGDVVAEAIGEEAFKKADEMLKDLNLELATDTATPREVIHEADHFAPSEQESRTAEQVLNNKPEDNIYLIQERPDRLQTFAVETKTPIAQASYDSAPAPKVTIDPRFDHVGKNIGAVPTSPRKEVASPAKQRGFFGRLFGG